MNQKHQDHKEKLLRANPKKGTNQVAVGNYNEKLVLQLVRGHGELTKAEATRATGLSPNAISVIFRSLESAGLLLRGEPIRGRIGQPSIPLHINPQAYHYVVLKVGRRIMELAVVNFAGEIIASREILQPLPKPQTVLDFVKSELSGILRSAKKTRKAIASMAVAMPFELWSWIGEFDTPTDGMEAWQDFDIAHELGKHVPWPVLVENDATAACRAELVLGSYTEKQDWIYFYIGTFIGGGIVLNGSVFPGRRGNAGGFGPMRVPEQAGGSRLVDHASLIVLERCITAAGGEPFSLYEQKTEWAQFEPWVSQWIVRAGRNLAYAIVSSMSVLDFEAVVIDGAIPVSIKARLVDEVRTQLEHTDLQGVIMPAVEAGQVGWKARTLGAAAALISVDYLNDQNRLREVTQL